MFTLKIETDNAAFEEDTAREEIARLLRHAADQVEEGYSTGPLIDFNGNRVGTYTVSDLI